MQLKVNLADGKTDTYKLPEELSTWQRRASDPEYQAMIRGVGVIRGDECCVMPNPRMFRGLSWDVEMDADDTCIKSTTVLCMADDVMVRATVYANKTKMTRLDVKKLGKQRWKPQQV